MSRVARNQATLARLVRETGIVIRLRIIDDTHALLNFYFAEGDTHPLVPTLLNSGWQIRRQPAAELPPGVATIELSYLASHGVREAAEVARLFLHSYDLQKAQLVHWTA